MIVEIFLRNGGPLPLKSTQRWSWAVKSKSLKISAMFLMPNAEARIAAIDAEETEDY
jgi:hypothetical protein